MDMTMVDLGPPDEGSSVAIGEEAVLFGPNGPTAEEVAVWADTIPYEILSGVSARVPRTPVSTAESTADLRAGERHPP